MQNASGFYLKACPPFPLLKIMVWKQNLLLKNQGLETQPLRNDCTFCIQVSVGTNTMLWINDLEPKRNLKSLNYIFNVKKVFITFKH